MNPDISKKYTTRQDMQCPKNRRRHQRWIRTPRSSGRVNTVGFMQRSVTSTGDHQFGRGPTLDDWIRYENLEPNLYWKGSWKRTGDTDTRGGNTRSSGTMGLVSEVEVEGNQSSEHNKGVR